MDPDIVNATRYRDVIDDALLDIPTISLVSDRDNLFDKFIGIYVNALQDGIAWERPASMELINPDGSEGFQINAGLRIRGGYSRDRNNPKHAFRVFFRSEYGDSKLNYPLFGKEGVDEFEKVDLRTAQNYSWSFNSWQGYNNTMAREVFSRDLQREMGQPYTRSRYYHLYLNGQYWGVFQTQERSEARFAKSYLGGEVEDYDVVKAAWTHVEATDGSTLAYNDFWALANSGFSSNNAYKQAQGLNPDGTGNPAYPKYLDVDNLIDYMTCVYYAGDFDSPISWFGGNDYINNFYAIYNRNNPDGWKFFRHDGEHTLLAYDMNFSQSIDRTGPYSVGSSVNQFNPQWLHQQLTGNQEYLIRFADRVHKHFANGGILTPANASDLFMSRANQIDMAIIAESARWGDSKVPAPRHRHKDWVPAINAVVDNFFPTRTNLVLNQLKSKGWYPSIDPPVFYINGSYKHGGYISAGDNLSMINPNGSGNLYYTLDGEDPRVSVAGSVAPTAIRYIGENITINESTQVKARLLDGGEWTALNDATYGIGPTAESLRISEIMYNPVGDPNSEFIELENIGAVPINLKLASFTDGIDFTFGSHILASGNYVVVVRNLSAFNTAYPNYTGTIAGVYSGSLDNGGETIKLEDAVGSSILDFRYKDGWYDITDGGGFSLTLLDSSNADLDSWSEKASWTSSTVLGGTPGQADTGQKPGDIVINEVLAHSDTVAYDWIELHNTTSSPIDIGGWFLSDSGSDDPNLMKYEIALGDNRPLWL